MAIIGPERIIDRWLWRRWTGEFCHTAYGYVRVFAWTERGLRRKLYRAARELGYGA